MRRTIAILVSVLAALVVGCSSDGVSQTEYDLVASELVVANQELVLAKEELTLTSEQLGAAEQRVADAVADKRSAEAELAVLEDEIDELFTIDAGEEEVMQRQQALGVLGTLFVEFRGGGWSEDTLAMFDEFVEATGEESMIKQLDVFAAAVAIDPDSEQANYEFGLLGFEIMSALEREVVDPFGR